MNLFKIKKKTGFGFIDDIGQEVVKPKFFSVNEFHEGLAFATIKEGEKFLSGFIDKDGEWVMDPIFKLDPYGTFNPIIFNEGAAPVLCKSNKWKFIKKDGSSLTEEIYEEAYEFSESRALVKRDGKYGYIDENGNEVIPCQFGLLSFIKRNHFFSDKLALVRFGDAEDEFDKPANLGFINHDGETYLDGEFKAATRFSHEMAMVNKGRMAVEYVYMNIEGEFPFPDLVMYETTTFSDGLSEMMDRETDLFGYIDLNGKWIIEPKYTKTLRFSEGLACVNRPYIKQSGFINKNGELVIDERFSNALPFKNGLSSVVEKGKNGYINTKGEYVWRG